MNDLELKNFQNKNLFIFFIIIGAVGLATGLTDTVLNNYLKEVYDITATQRGLIEFPRELPGLLCLLIISGLSFLGDIRIAFIAQILAVIGTLILGLLTPVFGVMLIFLFIMSSGQHIFMPVSDSIFIALNNDEEKVGKRMGQYKSIYTAFALIAGVIAFVGFRYNIFSFTSSIKPTFIISSVFFAIAAYLFYILIKRRKDKIIERKFNFIFDWDYRYYYILAGIHGAQKQVMLVFGPWVLVKILEKETDTIALLTIIGSFIGIFFLRALGKWIDRFGIKKLLYLDAISFIAVYFLYGLVTWGFSSNLLPHFGWPVLIVGFLFVLDKISMNMSMVRILYLKSIAKKPEHITASISTGISLDHFITIGFAVLAGIVWDKFGPQYVFFTTALLSFINVYIAGKVKIPKEASIH
ncbi:MAG: MFS transporter [Eubacteriales bacterium]